MNNKPFFTARILLPPTTNESYIRVTYKTKNGMVSRMGASPALRQFKRDAPKMLAAQRSKQDWSVISAIREKYERHIHTHLTVTLTFHLRYMWTSDNDGRAKGSQDAAFAFMGLNDNMAVRTIIEKCLAEDDGETFCDVTVAIKDGFEYEQEKPKRVRKSTKKVVKTTEVEKELKKMRMRGQRLAKTVRKV